MKVSKFNTFIDIGNGEMLAFNSSTFAFAKLDKNTYDTYLKLVSQDEKNGDYESDPLVAASIADFRKGGFLVDDGVDEIEILRVDHLIRRFANQHNYMGFTIAPTADCNFKCDYCYENFKSSEYMSREIEDLIIKYVDKHLKLNGALRITWFGGEPLLALDTIYRLSEAFIKIADERKSRYSAGLITNGYLLNREVASNLKKVKVDGVQITIDGVPEYHDKKRCLKDGGGTFNTIFNNLREVCNDFNIVIRVNLGRDNVDSFPEFLDQVEQYGVKDKILLCVADLEAREYLCREVKDAVFTSEEYSKAYTRLVDMIVERGVNTNVIPRSHAANCASITLDGFLIGPDGSMYKCWDLIGNPSECIAKIGQSASLMDGSLKWLAYDIFKNEECCNCSVLPLCMGGCPRKTLVKDEALNLQDHCLPMKYNLPELLKILYKQKKLMKKTG